MLVEGNLRPSYLRLRSTDASEPYRSESRTCLAMYRLLRVSRNSFRAKLLEFKSTKRKTNFSIPCLIWSLFEGQMEFLAKLILMIRPAQAHGQEIEMGCV